MRNLSAPRIHGLKDVGVNERMETLRKRNRSRLFEFRGLKPE